MNKYKVADTVLTILVIVVVLAIVVAAAVFSVRWVSSHKEPEGRVYKSVRIYEQELIASPMTVDKDSVYAVYFNALLPFSVASRGGCQASEGEICNWRRG